MILFIAVVLFLAAAFNLFACVTSINKRTTTGGPIVFSVMFAAVEVWCGVWLLTVAS